MRAIEGFQGLDVVQISGTEVIFIIPGEPVEVLDQIPTEVGSRWMRPDVVPLLAGPPERDIAPVIASSGTEEAGSVCRFGTQVSGHRADPEPEFAGSPRGHSSPSAALRYQYATEDRDRAIAETLGGLVPKADLVPSESAGASPWRQQLPSPDRGSHPP